VAKYDNIRERVLSGSSDANIDFDDLCGFVENSGFVRKPRKATSHQIFSRTGIIEIINLQPDKNGKAKAYQVKQVRRLFKKYGL
jgi:hypothetical protein